MVKQLTVKEYERAKWWTDTQKWIENIPQELDSKKPVPKKEWKVFEAESWDDARHTAWNAALDAARSAALHAALDAARRAAVDAAWYAAKTAARRAAGAAARRAALDAARRAAVDAACGAAGNAAGNAAVDAALLARIKICAGLNIDKKHIKYAEERWEANKRGFRVWCDVNGVLYVYRKK